MNNNCTSEMQEFRFQLEQVSACVSYHVDFDSEAFELCFTELLIAFRLLCKQMHYSENQKTSYSKMM
jgi:hypothetical protein